jgi:hypothetical protein
MGDRTVAGWRGFLCTGDGKFGVEIRPTCIPKEPLINPSFRRMPESIALHSLDPGMRRDDEKRINQKFPNIRFI